MYLCKNQVKASTKYPALEMSLDTMDLLSIIKKLLYTWGTNNLNLRWNKVMAIMNLITLYHERY